VKKLRRIVLIAFGTVIALGAIVLIGVNLYVQSQTTQAKIQQELSQRLGTPLQIGQMSVTPWGGLKLSGITIAQRSSASASHFLEARTFRLRVRFLSLFTRRLVIKEVSLVDPKVVWPQDAGGKWRLPGAREEEPISTPPPNISESQVENGAALATSPPVFTPVPLLSPAKGAIAGFPSQPTRVAVAPEVQKVSIKGGNFTFLDRTGRILATFAGVDFRSSLRSALALRGSAKIAKVSLRDHFFLEELKSPLSYEPDVLELSKISARVGGGEMSGYFVMQPEAEDSPFSASMKFREVLADEIVTDAGGPKGMVQGKLEGKFEASGKTADPDALTGKGEIFLRDGRVRQYSVLVLLGQILQIEELTELHLDQAEAKYHISPGLVTIDELILRSPNLRLSGTGTVAFDGNLKLESQLAINEKIHGHLFKAIRENFRPVSEPGYFALDFKVGGSIDRPKTDLMDKLVGNVINSLFGGGKTERPKKKKKRAEAATPAAPLPPAPPEEAPPQPAATPASSP
jgi:hypothetical protein